MPTVNPYRKLAVRMLKLHFYVLALGLRTEESEHIADKSHHIRLLHLHLHLSLVDFSKVEYLIDQMEDAVGIALHYLVSGLPV